MKETPPCYGCKIKTKGCHSSCELYKAFVIKSEENKQKRREYIEQENAYQQMRRRKKDGQ